MQSAAVPEQVLKTLHDLRDAGAVRGFYLGGGTSLALRLHHRVSIDLDWFSPEPLDVMGLRIALTRLPYPVTVQNATAGNLRFAAADRDGPKVEMFHYPEPLLEPLEAIEGVDVASLLDVALMKLVAVSNRGMRKDFIDLCAVFQRLDPASVLRRVPDKFPRVRPDAYHVIRSLGYFEEATDRVVVLREDLNWDSVRAFFLDLSQKLGRDLAAGILPW